ncbi:MAG: thiamine phosphate synthase [Bacteroidales bacterium]|nr:thiamine phosphate synthase [Bacteroidales bacterium]
MIQFISHQNAKYSYLDGIKLALEGGCRWIQLRMKDSSEDEIVSLGKEVKKLCEQYHATFIVDDHVGLVKVIGADGVHLGKNDMPVDTARRILGQDSIIGATANTFDDVLNAYNKGANYIGCGPFRFTTTKKNLSPVLGLDGYRQIVSRKRAQNINIPIVAIGGILKEDISEIMSTGISGIALSGAVLNALDPVSEMKTIIKILEK